MTKGIEFWLRRRKARQSTRHWKSIARLAIGCVSWFMGGSPIPPSGDPINDRVVKVKRFTYCPDEQTTFLFLDEMADEIHQSHQYIKRLEKKVQEYEVELAWLKMNLSQLSDIIDRTKR